MDINDVNNFRIVTGIPMLTGLPLADRYRDDRLPPGNFIVIDETGAERNPGRESFGNDFKLLYRESA